MAAAWPAVWAANPVATRRRAVVLAKTMSRASDVTVASQDTSIWIRKIYLVARLASVTAIRPSADRLLVTPAD